MDETATVEELGKNIGSDKKNDKSTFISLCGMEKTETMLAEATKEAINALMGIENSEFLKEFAMYLLKRRT